MNLVHTFRAPCTHPQQKAVVVLIHAAYDDVGYRSVTMTHTTWRLSFIALCTLLAAEGAFAQIACAANQYVSNYACVNCPLGKARAAGDNPFGSDTACLMCAEGYRVASKGADASTAGTCTACPTGFTTPAADSTSAGTVVAACLHCAEDYFVAALGSDATTAGTCTACPAGTTNDPLDLSTSAGSIDLCDGVVACAEDEHVSAHVCTACPTGFTRPAGDDPSGSDTACLMCAEGYRVASKGADASTAGTCTACPAGFTTPSAVSTSDGTVVAGCLHCDVGYRVASKGNDDSTAGTCTACATGFTTPSAVSTSEGTILPACLYCTQDYYVAALGTDSNTPGTCTACPSGTASKGAASSNTAGDLSTADGEISSCDDAKCADDKYISTVAGCVSCVADHYVSVKGADEVSAGTCTACPAGTTNAAGDKTTVAVSSCDATLCPANKYVSSNVCTDCPSGTTNAAGDDASGANTSCDDPAATPTTPTTPTPSPPPSEVEVVSGAMRSVHESMLCFLLLSAIALIM